MRSPPRILNDAYRVIDERHRLACGGRAEALIELLRRRAARKAGPAIAEKLRDPFCPPTQRFDSVEGEGARGQQREEEEAAHRREDCHRSRGMETDCHRASRSPARLAGLWLQQDCAARLQSCRTDTIASFGPPRRGGRRRGKAVHARWRVGELWVKRHGEWKCRWYQPTPIEGGAVREGVGRDPWPLTVPFYIGYGYPRVSR